MLFHFPCYYILPVPVYDLGSEEFEDIYKIRYHIWRWWNLWWWRKQVCSFCQLHKSKVMDFIPIFAGVVYMDLAKLTHFNLENYQKVIWLFFSVLMIDFALWKLYVHRNYNLRLKILWNVAYILTLLRWSKVKFCKVCFINHKEKFALCSFLFRFLLTYTDISFT